MLRFQVLSTTAQLVSSQKTSHLLRQLHTEVVQLLNASIFNPLKDTLRVTAQLLNSADQ